MAGGLGGLGGFGSVLGALGQSLLTSPRENPFQGLPAALQASAKDREHQAALSAMSTVAEKLGIPRELAASPEAMKLFIDHINATKFDELRRQAAQISLTPPDEGGATSQPALSVPGVQNSSSGIPTTFNVAGGGLDGPGGLGGSVAGASRVRTRPGGLGATPNLPAFAAIQGGTPSGKIAGVISQAAERYGLDPAALVRTAQIESGLRPNAKNPTSSAGGLFQFINSTARQYGLTNKFDPVASADAGARLMRDNADKLRSVLGRDPQPWELYLAHQQGSGGAAKLLSNPNASAASLVGADAVRLNGGSPGMTAQQFAGIWRKKFGDLPTASQNATGLLAAASGTTPDYAQADAQRLAATAGAPVQLASADPNMPLPSSAMQRVQAEAAARGIGQGGPDTGQAGAGIGQSGAPLNQVAAGRGRMTVPIPGALTPGASSLVPPRPPYTGSDPTTPAPVTAPAAPPPVSPPPATPPAGEGTNKTKAWAKNLFQYGMNQLALSNGDPVLMKQAEIILQRAAKYGDPSDTAKRVAEAGFTGTPVGRALTAGFPNHVIEKLLEQQIPGYESPGTLEQKKFISAEDERRWQHNRLETVFGAEQEERASRLKLDREKFANTIGQQTLDYNLRTKAAELDQNKFNYERYKTDRAYRQQVDESIRTANTKDYDAYARQELEQGRTPKSRLDYTVTVARAGGQQPETVEDVKRAEGVTAFLNKQAERAPGLAQRSADLDLLSRVINKTATGKGANLRAQIDAFAAELGMSSGTIASQKDLIDSITNRIAPSLREPGSGSQSDAELRGFLSAMPHMAGQPGGNELINSVLRRSSDIDNRRSDIAAKWQSGEMKASEARSQIAALDRASIYSSPKERELVDRFMGGLPDQQIKPPEKPAGTDTVDTLKALPEGKYGRTPDGNIYKMQNGKLKFIRKD